MKTHTFLAPALAIVAMVCMETSFAVTKTLELPPDGIALTASELPGYQKAQENCTRCHSAEYMRYQPPTASRAYWDAMVKRMKVVFKGPIPDEDMPAIVDYLVKTYGNEQSK